MLATVHPHIHHAVPAHCRLQHGHRYCAALEQRHAIRVLRPEAIREERRAGRPHRRYRVSWALPQLVKTSTRLRRHIRWLRTVPSWHPTTVVGAVCKLWNPCEPALRVFRCESGLSTSATNGQYLGFAQMGDYARSRYGHGPDAWSQAVAAHAYYMDSGWSPWECARLTGVI